MAEGGGKRGPVPQVDLTSDEPEAKRRAMEAEAKAQADREAAAAATLEMAEEEARRQLLQQQEEGWQVQGKGGKPAKAAPSPAGEP